MSGIRTSLAGPAVARAGLSGPRLAPIAAMLAAVRRGTPVMLLIRPAGLAGVPQDQMRAATPRGAGPVRRRDGARAAPP